MKTMYVSAALLFMIAVYTQPLQAQTFAIEKGSIEVGGSASITTQKIDMEDADRFTSISISPQAEYFLANGFSVGGNFLLQYFKAGNSDSFAIGVGPSATYYFSREEKSLYPFVSGVVRYQMTDQASENTSAYGFEVSGGLMKMINRNVGLTGRLFYEFNDDDDLQWNAFGLSLGISTFILK